jgi:hypothetical protein
MTDNKAPGTIFVAEHTLLPSGLTLESEAFLPGWRAVTSLDGYALGRKIEEAKWNFFYLAGGTRALAHGFSSSGTMRKAILRALAKRVGQQFNSLEITKVVSKRFLGVRFVTVTTHCRHIQHDMGLVAAGDLALRTEESERGGGAAENFGTGAKRQHTALISSS